MGLWSWLTSLFRPRPLVRDVATLSGADAESTQETVASSDAPLKPHHRRRGLRDARLLPKPKSKAVQSYLSAPFKKKKYLPADEAKRLFSTTFRTQNRKLRDLAIDEEQLARYGLPVWRTEADLAQALGLTVKHLRHYSLHRQRETCAHYVTFALPKRSGGYRLIHAPKRRLKAIQRQLNELLVNKLPVSPHAHGFLPERSVATNAAPHVGKKLVIKLDLKDCFPSIHYGRIRGLFIALGYDYPVATTLAVLMTECERQPVEADGKLYHVPVGPRVCVQGAPTSPGLCNAVLLRMDRRLNGLARKRGFAYTRYADDLTFSGDDPAQATLLISIAGRIAREEGWQLNREKTRILRQGRRQQVTGVVVNQQMGLSRKERRRMRAAIHQLQRTPDPVQMRQLRGKLAYLQMLSPSQAAPLQSDFQKLMSR